MKRDVADSTDRLTDEITRLALRADTLDWAYNNLRLDQPHRLLNLPELAAIALEVIDRDTRDMIELAKHVRKQRSEDSDDLACTKRELRIAGEWLCRGDAVALRLKANLRALSNDPAIMEGRIQEIITEIRNAPLVDGALDDMLDEVAEEDRRREARAHGIVQPDIMADRVPEAERNDAQSLEEEFAVALEWLSLQRRLAARYREVAVRAIVESGSTPAQADTELRLIEGNVRAVRDTDDTPDALMNEVMREARRREAERDGEAA